MATCREIITSALRKIGGVSEGQPAPVPYDAQVALETLQGWYIGAVNQGVFGRLNDVLVEDDYEVEEFDRVTVTSGAPLTITFPATVDDCGTERSPVDLCPVVVANNDTTTGTQSYLYDANVSAWVALDDLGLDDEAPLSNRGSEGLACLLAVALAEGRGKTVGPITSGRAATFVATLTARGGSQRRTVGYDSEFM